MQQQAKSSQKFKEKYPTLEYIVENANTVGDNIIDDKDILNNITSFNKVGVSIIKPHYKEDIISKNYDIIEATFFGCQIMTMNFQINDNYMQKYLQIFKDSSFRLKPSSMRFTEVEKPSLDLLSIYQSIININDNIINDFYYNYNNKLISFESYTLLNTYLTQNETNLKFNLGTNRITNKVGDITYKIGVNQCFIIRKSTIGASDNIYMYLESASEHNMYLTLIGKTYNLQPLSQNKKGLVNQAFYFEKPKTIDDNQSNKGKMLSIRSYNDDPALYLAYENKNVKAYTDVPQIEARNNMTFYIKEIKSQTILKILTLFDGSLKTIGGNIIGIIESNTTDGTPYIVISTKNSGGNFDIFKDQFMLQNKITKTYVICDLNTGLLYDNEFNPSTDGIFSLVPSNGYYTILNTNSQKLILFDKNVVKFVENNAVMSNQSLFKLDLSYEILE